MTLTLRTNGSGASNLVTAAWWNDFYNLLTGNMTDQPVQIAQSLTMTPPQSKPSAPTLARVSGTSMSIGAYTYGFTNVNSDGAESPISTTASLSTTSGNQKIKITFGTGPVGTTKRKLYRTTANGSQLYFLTTISDNTTTNYTDTSGNNSSNPFAPTDGSLGGLQLWDPQGNPQGYLTGASGRLAMTTPTTFQMQVPEGVPQLQIDNATGVTLYNVLNLGGDDPAITTAQGFIGFKQAGGGDLAEMKANGNFIISGTQYQTSSGGAAFATGQSFDFFDIGEVFQCDREYPNGTIVCPGPNDQLTQCTHENCHAAMVVSHNPGLGLGVNDHGKGVHYVAMSGRINVRTAQDLPPRTLVVSDGRGGVRAVRPGEPSFALGFTLNATTIPPEDHHPQVGLFLRPMFVMLKGK